MGDMITTVFANGGDLKDSTCVRAARLAFFTYGTLQIRLMKGIPMMPEGMIGKVEFRGES